MNVLGNVWQAEGNSGAARQQYQAALDLQQKSGEAYLAAETQVELSELALDDGHPDQAEPMLRSALAEFEKEKSDPDAASAYVGLSRALLMEDKLEGARSAIRHAAELSRTSPDPALKLPVEVQTARVMLAAIRHKDRSHPSLTAVRQELRSAAATARRFGYYGDECESRLALGELEAQANPPLGRSMLTTLAGEAHQHGMELIVRKATALAAGGTAMVVTPSPSR